MRERLDHLLRSRRVLLTDGAMGTMLQGRGLPAGSCGEAWNVERPEEVLAVHRAWRASGCDLLTTNTFGANRFRLALHGRQDEVRELNHAGAALARTVGGPDLLVLGSIGPSGAILAPLGDADPDLVRQAFATQAAALLAGGADALLVETQTALDEMALAAEAAREAGAPDLIVSFAFDRTRRGEFRTMMGVRPEEAAAAAEASGASVVGFNCGTGLGMDEWAALLQEFRRATTLPLLARPNAGLPALSASGALYPASPEDFAAALPRLLDAGASLIGGCCGTAPPHLAALRAALSGASHDGRRS